MPATRAACLLPKAMFGGKGGQWGRLLWAPLLHLDAFHLYVNMTSFLWKASRAWELLGGVALARLLCGARRRPGAACHHSSQHRLNHPQLSSSPARSVPRPQGSQLEPRLGPLPFLRLIGELALVSNAVYLAGTLGLLRCGGAAGAYGAALWRTCVVGFSGVLFGLKARACWLPCSLAHSRPPACGPPSAGWRLIG